MTAKEFEDKRAAERTKCIRAVMDTEDGRRFVYDALAFCGVYRSSWDRDLSTMAMYEGQRNVGLHLMAECKRVAPRGYRLMEDEAALREAKEARDREAVEKATKERELSVD